MHRPGGQVISDIIGVRRQQANPARSMHSPQGFTGQQYCPFLLHESAVGQHQQWNGVCASWTNVVVLISGARIILPSTYYAFCALGVGAAFVANQNSTVNAAMGLCEYERWGVSLLLARHRI